MNIYLQFLMGFLAYSAAATLSYFEPFKESKYFLPLGVAIGAICNLTWMTIAKYEKNPSQLVLKGLYWDCMLMGIFILIPFLFFKASISMTQTFGILLVVAGLILTKI